MLKQKPCWHGTLKDLEHNLPEGQTKLLLAVMDIVRAVPNGHGLGIVYGEPAWTAVPGNGWENQALFDFNNRALPAMSVFKNP